MPHSFRKISAVIALIILIVAAIFFVTNRPGQVKWQTYHSTTFPVSFDFPVAGSKIYYQKNINVQIDYGTIDPTSTSTTQKIKTIELWSVDANSGLGLVPPAPPVHSLEEALTLMAKQLDRPGEKAYAIEDAFPGITYHTVDGVQVAIDHMSDPGHPEVHAQFFFKNKVYQLRLINMGDDADRIWQSLKFLK